MFLKHQSWSTDLTSPFAEKDPVIITIIVMATIGVAVSLFCMALILYCICFYTARGIRNVFFLIFGSPQIGSGFENLIENPPEEKSASSTDC